MSGRGKLPERVRPSQCECGDHVFAPSSRGFNVLVSPEDAAFLEKKWFAKSMEYPGMTRTDTVNRRIVTVKLSRAIMCPDDGLEVDHINRDPSDNRRQNLRVCPHSDNAKNRRRVITSTTGVKGVRKHRNRFRADITLNYARHFLGYFDTLDEAKVAYVKAATRLHGEFARFE